MMRLLSMTSYIWQQDQVAAPFNVKLHFVTVWIALVDVTPRMGPLWFVDGSHETGAPHYYMPLTSDCAHLAISQAGPATT